MEKQNSKSTGRKWERRLAVLALLLLTIAWIAGTFRARGELLPYLRQLLPGAGYFEPVNDNLFKAWQDETKTETQGYGGAMRVITAVSSQGVVEDILVVVHKETSSFFRRVEKRDFIKSLN